MTAIGHDSEILDEAVPADYGESTRTMLLSTLATNAAPVATKRANTGIDALDAQLEVLLGGGAPEVVLQGYGGGSTPTLASARDLLPAGTGVVVAPEAVASADHVALTPALWSAKKTVLLNAPKNSSQSALTTIGNADIAAGDMRGGGLWGDWATFTRTSGTVDAPATLGIAAAICRNGKNSGRAAGGKYGILRGAVAIVGGEKSRATREALADARVNTLVLYRGDVRNYGFFSLANPATLPHWWGLQVARVIADYRARCADLEQETMFEDISERTINDALGDRQAVLLELLELGALKGPTPSEAFRVRYVSTGADEAAGFLKFRTSMKVGPHVIHLLDQISNRPITANL